MNGDMFKMVMIVMLLVLCVVFYGATAHCQTDGPATLPRSIPPTSYVSSNPPKAIPPTANLQTVLNAAVCGDVLNLDNTLVYTGSLKLPRTLTGNCDAQHAITMQAAIPAQLDAKGRVIPGQQLPKIILPFSNSNISGGVFFVMRGVEVTTPTNRKVIYNLIAPGVGAHDIILDSVWVHGTATDETQRGLLTSYVTNLTVMNSVFTDFHCLAVTGACSDSQAVAGGLTAGGDEGPILLLNDYLEGAGENVLFGGGHATVVPHDITITGSTIAKQKCWNPDEPCFVPVNGQPFVVKNLLEFKNAAYVLVEKNDFEYAWGGFSQLGFAWLITPKNQANSCGICADHDITIRYNNISWTGGAFQMGFGPSDAGGWPAAANSYSIHNNNWRNLNYAKCHQCTHYLMQVSSGVNNGEVLNSVYLASNTLALEGQWHPPGPTDGKAHGFLMLTAPPIVPGVPQIYGMTFANNVVPAGNTPIYSTGGGPTNCINAFLTNYAQMFLSCWSKSTVTGNIILATDYPNTAMPWPAGNYVLAAGANPDLLP